MSYFQEEVDIIKNIIEYTDKYIDCMEELLAQTTYKDAKEDMNTFIYGCAVPFMEMMRQAKANANMDVHFTEGEDENRHNSSSKAD